MTSVRPGRRRLVVRSIILLCAAFVGAPDPAQAQGRPLAWLFTSGPSIWLNGAPAQNGIPINNGDTVTTGPDSGAKVLLAAGGSVQLDANTQPQFLAFVQEGYGCLVRVVLNSGQLYAEGRSACVSRGASIILPRSEFNYQIAAGTDLLTVTIGQVGVGGAQWEEVAAGTQASIAGGIVVARRQLSFEELRRVTSWRDRFRFTQAGPPPVPPPVYAPPPVIPNFYIPIPWGGLGRWGDDRGPRRPRPDYPSETRPPRPTRDRPPPYTPPSSPGRPPG